VHLARVRKILKAEHQAKPCVRQPYNLIEPVKKKKKKKKKEEKEKIRKKIKRKKRKKKNEE
jgi:hypothetical protein